MRIVQYSLKQLIVIVPQQLIKVWHVRWTEAASLAAAEKCVYALAVGRRDEPAPQSTRVTRTSAAIRRPLVAVCPSHHRTKANAESRIYSNGDFYAPAVGGIKRYRDPSVWPAVCHSRQRAAALGYRHAVCLQLSHMLTADQSACRVAVPGAITCSKLEKKLS